MRKLKIYLETTMFNRFFETERDYSEETQLLFEEIKYGKYEAYTSAYVIEELEKAPEPKKSKMIDLVFKFSLNVLDTNDSVLELAEKYVQMDIVPPRFSTDALHIAIATVNELDFILSLNFHHINKLKTKTATEVVNKMLGYSCPFIVTPMEVIEYETEK